MRVLIFHGYLLAGTGSNVYNARLAEALVRLGHEVHLLSQDRDALGQPFVDAAGDWDEGSLKLRVRREPVRCTVYRPDVGTLLPVYVADRYEGMQARTFLQCSDAEVEAYVEANVEAVREVAERVEPEVALANHLVMGPAILARALAGAAEAVGRRVPYAVKVHGSALEYTVKRDPQRFLPYAVEGLAAASTILVGSRHTAESLWQALGDPALERRTRLGPPGVDVERFAPRQPQEAHLGLGRLARRLRASAEGAEAKGAASAGGVDEASKVPEARATEAPEVPEAPDSETPSSFARDEREAAQALGLLAEGQGEIVAFVGKLIAAKGIDLLVAAWPLVLERHPQARLAIVGFGGWREQVEEMCQALAAGDLRRVERDALPYVAAFLRSLDAHGRERYGQAARQVGERVLLTGRLEHDELADLLPACSALVVPSTFPEAFGMVAAEAAACGALPVSARHSGLAEVSETLASAVPAQAAGWLSFAVDDGAVRAIAERLCGWLETDAELRAQARAGLVAAVRERWSWEGVARGVIGAALGEPDAGAFG